MTTAEQRLSNPTDDAERIRGVLRLPVLRLQIQLRPMKPGKAPWRVYEPSCLLPVQRLRLTPRGVIGVLADGTEVLDVHHADHQLSRDPRGRAGISIMTTGDYVALRRRYGDHLADGIAGEGVLVDYRPGLARRAMPERLVVRRRPVAEVTSSEPRPGTSDPDADLVLHSIHVADPCVEFTRFCLGLPASDVVGEDVRQGLIDLGAGARGYKMVAEREWVLELGDQLVVDLGD